MIAARVRVLVAADFLAVTDRRFLYKWYDWLKVKKATIDYQDITLDDVAVKGSNLVAIGPTTTVSTTRRTLSASSARSSSRLAEGRADRRPSRPNVSAQAGRSAADGDIDPAA
jgi:hypothetical protein